MKARILVVDDSRDVADCLALLVRQAGHEGRACYSGQEALACLDDFRPHAVMIDHAMPGMTGDEVARRIREKPEHSNLILIALAGLAGELDGSAQLFSLRMIKPVGMNELQGVVAMIGSLAKSQECK